MSLLIETTDGKLIRKERRDIAQGDFVVFDGPDAFESTTRLQRELEAEIAAAGGIEAWRAQHHEPAHA